ncbi:MAG TPA: hypothetical protein VKZ18_27025 [Polyangia bacterium]|nr:hypothetical protein [Polyangia bacterium]
MVGRWSGKRIGIVAWLALLSAGCSISPQPAGVGVEGPRTRGPTARTRAVPPRNIHRRRTIDEATAASAPAGAHLNYYGGRVVSNMQVVQVIYGTGSYLPQVTSTASPSMATFYQGVLNSPYVDWLTEYDTNAQPAPNSNQVIGRGGFSAQVVITPSAANNGATIDDTNIQAELSAQIQAGVIPAPTHDAAGNNNTYYAIFFPHGKVITLQGEGSCSVFCAYHGTIANVPGVGEIYYGVHPDFQAGSGCENGCGAAPTAFGNVTQVASHEMMETITDAEVGIATVIPGAPLAWFDPTYDEIGDICNDMHGTVTGGDGVSYDVQPVFSNVANDCIVSRVVTPTIAVSALTFEGGTAVTGTVSLDAVAPAGGTAVALSSSVPTLVSVPSSVLVPAGSVSATFAVTSTQSAVETPVTLTATFPAATASVNVTVLASPTVASVSLSPTSVTGGTTSTATVTLTGAAPAGGATVTLTSANTSIATVPATVVVPAASTSATFTVTTSLESASTSVSISAAYHDTTKSALLTVTGVPGVASLTLNPPIVDGGNPSTATVSLSNPAPTGGAVVVLASSNPTLAAVPASVTVAAGLLSATFVVTTTAPTTPTVVTLAATYPAGLNVNASLTVSTPGNASFDATLKVPRCTTVGSFCDTGSTLIRGRASLGPELDTPNTLAAGCLDGTAGTFHSDESLDRLSVATLDGSPLAAGEMVRVTATVWAFDTSDFLDVFFAPDATNPVWTLMATITSTGTQQQLALSTQFALPSATLPVIRANWRFLGATGTCTTGAFDDRDDLVFALSGAPPVNLPPAVNAGPDQAITLPASASLSGTATDDGLPNPPGKLTTTWSLVSGPGTVTFGNASALATTATFSAAGSYDLRLTASDGALSASDDLIVTVSSPNAPPTVNAGPDQTIELPAAANLAGSASDDGLPNPPGKLTTTWSFVSGPGTVTFGNSAALATTATFSVAGTYDLRLTASDGALSTSDDLIVTVQPVNQAPVVNPGANETLNVDFPAVVALSGTVTDDGLPNPPGKVTSSWSVVFAPNGNTATIQNPASLQTNVTFSGGGTFQLRLTASDGALSTSADVFITVIQANHAPTVNAGPDQTITLPATASLNGTVTDDGLPNPPATFTSTWSVVSGPGTVTFANASNPVTTATFSAAGTYDLRLTANDSALSASDDLIVTVNAAATNTAPVVNAGPDQTITLPASASLAGTVTDDGLPNPPGAVTTTWSKVSGPGTVTFGNASARSTTATFSTAGSYVLQLLASDSALSASDTITVTVNAAATNTAPTVNAGPDLTITLPASATLNGTASDDGLPNPPGTLTVTWSKVSGPGTVTFASPNAKVTTATFSAAGTYVVQLTASDSALSASDTAQVTVNAASGSGPCASLCSNPVSFSISGSFQSGNIGTGAVCYQTTSVVHGGNCGNFVSPRTLQVNGTTEPCNAGNWASIPAARNGGYCVQTTAGNQPWAFFTAW